MSYGKREYISYVDGVPVKVSEQYKPLRKITLPSGCQNTNVHFDEYDFRLERSVLEKISELRRICAEESAPKSDLPSDEKLPSSLESKSHCTSDPIASIPSHLEPTPVLTPVTYLSEQKSNTQPYPKHINISDFETDNSSPFDNMELKTINDMEELASVLASSCLTNENNNNYDAIPKAPSDCFSYLPLNGYSNHSSFSSHLNYFPSLPYKYSYPYSNPYQGISQQEGGAALFEDGSSALTNSGHAGPSSQKSNSKSVPDIIQELEKELKEKRKQDQARSTKTPPPSSHYFHSNSFSDSNSYQSMDPIQKRLVKNISEMGFPRDRVIRTCEKFNGDDKKVIEFLLQIQRLEEQSFPGDLIEKALPINNYDEDETAKHLKAATTLLDLGFDADLVHRVLIESENDRDRALEKLIS